MKPGRCSCGRGLTRKVVRQQTPKKIKGKTITVNGRHLAAVGRVWQCGSCGPVRTIYR